MLPLFFGGVAMAPHLSPGLHTHNAFSQKLYISQLLILSLPLEDSLPLFYSMVVRSIKIALNVMQRVPFAFAFGSINGILGAP